MLKIVMERHLATSIAESPSYPVHELSAEAKRLMESLLGRQLEDGERVVVCAYAGEETSAPAETSAAENWERLLATQRALRGRVASVPEDELEAAMSEALDAARAGWTPEAASR